MFNRAALILQEKMIKTTSKVILSKHLHFGDLNLYWPLIIL
jgi:hypothetical protein